MYDIDKLYIIGHSIISNGTLPTNEKSKSKILREAALKNRVIDGILNIMKNPKNQINSTMPISTDNLAKIAEMSTQGEISKRMNPNNTASIYIMQEQNMIGKSVIGNVATGIKSFFGLTYTQNNKINEIIKLIDISPELYMEDILDILNLLKIPGVEKNSIKYLANLNISEVEKRLPKLKELEISNPQLSILTTQLESLINYQNRLSDKSLDLGELLNAATDNAKELILKKINADTNWVDIYIYRLLIGDDMQNIGKFMTSPIINEIVSGYSSNIISGHREFDQVKYINIFKNKYEKDSDEYKMADKLIFYVKAAKEMKLLGKMLKINQGISTDGYEKYSYIKKIETGISDITGVVFKLQKYLTDPTYKQEMIKIYGKERISFNILETVETSPHFSKMFDALNIDDTVLNRLSTVTNARNIILNNITDKISKIDYSNINAEIYNSLITKWLQSLNSNGKSLTFNVPKGIEFIDASGALSINNNSVTPITLNSLDNLQSFRLFVEQYIIPTLKEKAPNNEFIKQLGFAIRKVDGKDDFLFALPYNMMQIDAAEATKTKYAEALQAFTNLNVEFSDFPDISIQNIFYLYNLAVHRDGFGRTSMTRLFESMVSSGKNSWVLDFNNWIDYQDPNEIAEHAYNRLKLGTVISEPDDNSIGYKTYMDSYFVEETKRLNLLDRLQTGYKLSNESLIKNLLSNSKFSKGIKIINNDTIPNGVPANSWGFVLNGIIYINEDIEQNHMLSETLFHEFAHLIVGNLKLGKLSDAYYELVTKLMNSEDYLNKSTFEGDYLNKHDSDYIEEQIVQDIGIVLNSIDFKQLNSYEDYVEEVDLYLEYSTSTPEYKALGEFIASEDVFNLLLDFINNTTKSSKWDMENMVKIYSKIQEVASIKHALYNNNKLEEECK